MGRDFARRLAPRVVVEDLGRDLDPWSGRATFPDTTVRRRVLALLCFLLTRPDFRAHETRCWTPCGPTSTRSDALNSLNQTVYFLRRVFEEDYVDDLSPGLPAPRLGPDLAGPGARLKSQSNECRRLIQVLPDEPTPDQVEALSDQYTGRFALDFEYEEWAAPYRDWLHASYLRDRRARRWRQTSRRGHFDRGIRLARRALMSIQAAEHVEVSLAAAVPGERCTCGRCGAVRALRVASCGSSSDIEPPPLESL